MKCRTDLMVILLSSKIFFPQKSFHLVLHYKRKLITITRKVLYKTRINWLWSRSEKLLSKREIHRFWSENNYISLSLSQLDDLDIYIQTGPRGTFLRDCIVVIWTETKPRWHKRYIIQRYWCLSSSSPFTPLDSCSYALGMQSKSIQNHQITASYTQYSYAYSPWKARLESNDAWVISSGVNSWLQINLVVVKKVNGIATQGTHRISRTFVKEYELVYGNNTSSFLKYTKSFQGNIDDVGIVYNSIDPPIIASVVRILPIKFNLGSFVSLRVELYGCPYVGAWQSSN